jgi:type VI secretion system protein ImpL
MKRITPLTVLIWSCLFCVGMVSAVFAVFVPFLAGLFWTFAVLAWIGDGVWITMAFVRVSRSRPRGGGVIVGNEAVFQRMRRETGEAVSRYLSAVNRKGLFRRSALYERPWFLLCGTGRSGKSSLLRSSGLSFPLRYPAERDGVAVEGGGNQVAWLFGNEAVWIDTPGGFMEESGKDEWQSLVEALRRVRSDCPADGVALVVSFAEVLEADDLQIKALAQRLRGRVDEMITRWGIEFPVYLLLSRTDEVPGFREYFSEQIAAGDDQVFGATIARKDGAQMPRITFAEEFSLLCRSLNDFRLDRLHKERDPVKKRQICRFVIHFQSIQQKLGMLVAELFRSSNYAGKPIFRGFYFTSCIGKGAGVESAQPQHRAGPAVSATIVNHPLNPNRILGVDRMDDGRQPPAQKQEQQSLFVLPLFREIMVRDKPLVTPTAGRSRRQMLRHYALAGCIGLAALLFSFFQIAGYIRIASFYDQASAVFARLPSENAPLIEQYLALDAMQGVMERLQRYDDDVPLSMGVGLYRGRPLLRAIKGSYLARLRRCIVAPAVKYLEYDLRGMTGTSGELKGDDYDRMYRTLKAYLSVSEAAAGHPQDIDTAFLGPAIFEAVKKYVMSRSGADRLPAKIETVLNGNMGLLLTYLRRGEFRRSIQEDQRLVAGARARLRRLPGAEALYEAVIGQCARNASRISLDELLGRRGAGILVSGQTISGLYTQEGWTKTVKAALGEAAENPCRVDWVIGRQEVPESSFDKEVLFDDMVHAYLADYIRRWCAFLGAVEIPPFGDLPQAARQLRKLAGDKSELQKLLAAAGKATEIKEGRVGGAIRNMASKIKGARTERRRGKKFTFSFSGSASPFDDVNAVFERLRSFAASGGDIDSYKEKMLVLADKIGSLGAGDEGRILDVFSGRDDDPLSAAWKHTKNVSGVWSEELAEGAGGLLLKPFAMTGAAASRTVTRVLNEKWQGEVLKPFLSRFSGRYPFAARDEDASWNDVMDFFRPSTGTFWGFYERVLSPYIVRTSSGWMVRQLGAFELNFNPRLSQALSGADAIGSIFFKPDGTARTLEIAFSSSAGNRNAAKLEVDGVAYEVAAGKTAKIRWPLQGQGASLRIQVGKDFWQEFSFGGPWGFMKLVDAAKVNRLNSSTFNAKWQINVQNMYLLNFDARLQVSAADHPFLEPVFQQFDCPGDLVVASRTQQE